MKNKYWSRPYSKRLYEQALADVDRINYQNELNEKARTLSNRDKGLALAMGAAGMDNEPRFSERPVFSQIFTIDNEIKNLNQSLEIAMRNNESMRAKEIQDRIDSLNSLKQTMMPRDNIDQSLSEL